MLGLEKNAIFFDFYLVLHLFFLYLCKVLTKLLYEKVLFITAKRYGDFFL